MSKTLTTAAATAAAARTGTEPITVIEIQAPAPVGTLYFADRGFSAGAITALGRLTSLDSIRGQIAIGDIGSAGAVRATIADADGSIATKQNQAQFEGSTARVLLYFAGTADTDAVELFRGRIASPLVRAEAALELQITIEAPRGSAIAGFAPTAIEIPTIAPEGSGKLWPLVYGGVKDVPAVLLFKHPETQLASDIVFSNGQVNSSFWVVDAISTGFPQGSSIILEIDGFCFQGSFAGNQFIITNPRKNKYDDVNAAVRPPGDPDVNNPSVFWIDDPTQIIAGTWLEGDPVFDDTTGEIVPMIPNFCVAQYGTKCWFAQPWTSFSLNNDAFFGWLVAPTNQFSATKAFSFDPYIVVRIPIGSTVRWFEHTADVFVASESGGIVKAVHSSRRLPSGLITIVPIPSGFFSITYNDTSIYAGKSPITVHVDTALAANDPTWGADVYVSIQSDRSGNPSQAISDILTRYTDIAPDSGSFADARNATLKFPFEAAILNPQDPVSLAGDLAWQARCALFILGSSALIRYLSAAPIASDAPIVIDATNARDMGLEMESTDISELVTQLIIEWKPRWSQSFDYLYSLGGVTNSKFGTRKESRTVWAYQKVNKVAKSATFWFNRKSHIWRRARLGCFFPILSLDVLDRALVNLPGRLPLAPVIGLTMATDLSTLPFGVGVDIWLPIESGTAVVSANAYLSDSGDPNDDGTLDIGYELPSLAFFHNDRPI